jgi:hypothetical protein
MENYQDKEKFYLTSDLKLQAFLRLMLPGSFIGLNKTDPNRVNFVFKKSQELINFTGGYLSRKKYLLSPLSFSENIEQGKAMIYGDY